MPVNSYHPAFARRERDYDLIAHCIEGQRRIKEEGERYLPMPNPEDRSAENMARYKAYKKRAVFHNVTARTVGNMVGQCFAVDPVPTLPDTMLPWLEDISGTGVSADQQAKKALGYVVAYSRCFLWVDYPKTDGQVSVADQEAGNIRPRILLFGPRQIINWRVTQQGAKAKLSLVVIRERYIAFDDGYCATYAWQYRVLRLAGTDYGSGYEGTYISEIHRVTVNKEGISTGDTTIFERVQPLDGKGQPFTEIPGSFIGAESNDAESVEGGPSNDGTASGSSNIGMDAGILEKPLMLDIANLNIAHYRNSADYEESVYMLGQPTPFLTGLTDAWVEAHLKGGITLGSRSCIPLPIGANAGMLQANENTLPKEAMQQKEDLMEALGAKLVEKTNGRSPALTATEAGLNEASETSILAACCENVTDAYGIVLRFAARFANVDTTEPEKEILYELNTDFAISRMTAQEAQATLQLWQGDALTTEEMRDRLKNGGWAYLDDETYKDQIETQAAADFTQTQKELKGQLQIQSQFAAKPPAKGTPPPAA